METGNNADYSNSDPAKQMILDGVAFFAKTIFNLFVSIGEMQDRAERRQGVLETAMPASQPRYEVAPTVEVGSMEAVSMPIHEEPVNLPAVQNKPLQPETVAAKPGKPQKTRSRKTKPGHSNAIGEQKARSLIKAASALLSMSATGLTNRELAGKLRLTPNVLEKILNPAIEEGLIDYDADRKRYIITRKNHQRR